MSAIASRLRSLVVLLAVLFLCIGCTSAPALNDNPWELLSLPTESNLLDLDFTGGGQRGWLVGSQTTLLETHDGGSTWQPRDIEWPDENARFSTVSFSGAEGWIVGQPSVLLHTKDGGDAWEQVPLSERLPGQPTRIYALGPDSAEMVTDVGAIYRTDNGGQTWKATVQEAVGLFRNIERSSDGQYVAVSSRGNFYSTWHPGEDSWHPYNRESSRRVQNMGFSPQGNLWMLARGGQLQFSDATEESWHDPIFPQQRSSWGLLDLAYRTPNELWVAGGGGSLLASFDGGQTWQQDRGVEDVPSNFLRIKFFGDDRGFVIGQRGVLLRYRG